MERFFHYLMRKGGKISALIEIGRPWNGFAVAMLGIIGAFLAGAVSSLALIFLAADVFIIYVAATILNDVYDVEIDKINMPYRPLQTESIKKISATYASLILYILGISISFFVSLNFFIVIVAMSLLSAIYSLPPLELKNRGFVGNAILGFDTVFMSMLAGYVYISGSVVPGMPFVFCALFFSLSYIFLSVIKDLKDIQGDKFYGKKTVAVSYGKRTVTGFMLVGSALFLASMYLFNLFFFNSIVFLLSSAVVLISILAITLNVYKKNSVESGENMWTLLRAAFLVLLIIMLFFSLTPAVIF